MFLFFFFFFGWVAFVLLAFVAFTWVFVAFVAFHFASFAFTLPLCLSLCVHAAFVALAFGWVFGFVAFENLYSDPREARWHRLKR